VNFTVLRRIAELEEKVKAQGEELSQLKAKIEESKRTLTLPREKNAGYRQTT
jgi:hypothetical protein